MNYKKKVAEKLLEIKAVALSPKDPFTWASGIKSPIYCDNRLTLSYPEVRDLIAEGLKEIVKENLPETEVLAGTATAGIPHAAYLSQKLDLPMIYVRSSAKEHGKGNQVEGVLKKGQKIVVVEDLISTGGSSLKVVDVLREAEAEVLGLLAIFTYGFENADQNFKEKNTKYFTLTDYNTLIEVALEKEYITEEELKILKEWRENPKTYYKNK